MNVLFSELAWKEYTDWLKVDKKMMIRINDLIKDIQRNGMLVGIGNPELLKHGLSGLYSRQMLNGHRLVYSQDENGNLVIAKCRGHY